MVFIALAGIILALTLGPTLWVKHVLAKYATPRTDFPGTGGEFARHILDQAGLAHVAVEEAPSDHYSPAEKAVRLTKDKLDQRSLTAVVVAAHEVGHALQDNEGYRPLIIRTKVMKLSFAFDKVAGFLGIGLSVIGSAAISPRLLLFMVAVFCITGLVGVIARLITLPVEIDASFNRALPILGHGYLPPEDENGARQILRAAAFTYVADALLSSINVFRYIRYFR